MTTTATPRLSESARFDAQRLVDLHAVAVAADKHAGQQTSRETIERSLSAHRAHSKACEAFRRRYFPRTHRVVAVFGEVFTVSRTGRSIRLVWSAERAGVRA